MHVQIIDIFEHDIDNQYEICIFGKNQLNKSICMRIGLNIKKYSAGKAMTDNSEASRNTSWYSVKGGKYINSNITNTSKEKTVATTHSNR